MDRAFTALEQYAGYMCVLGWRQVPAGWLFVSELCRVR